MLKSCVANAGSTVCVLMIPIESFSSPVLGRVRSSARTMACVIQAMATVTVIQNGLVQPATFPSAPTIVTTTVSVMAMGNATVTQIGEVLVHSVGMKLP